MSDLTITVEGLRSLAGQHNHTFLVVPDLIVAIADRIDKLEQWQAEALQVLVMWDRVWEACGRPGPLGESKAQCVLDWVLDVKEDRGFQHEHKERGE